LLAYRRAVAKTG
jgi:hypothetical protein